MGVFREFIDFIEEYKIMGLAVAFILSTASLTLIKSLVDNIIMPIITPFIPQGAWKAATFSMGPIVISWGLFLGELINFTIIAFAVFFIVRQLQRTKNLIKK